MSVRSHRCGCGTAWCRLDTLLHALRVTVRPICDRHDAGMLGMDWSTFKVWNSGEKTVYLNAATSRWVTVDPRTWRT